jgi:hypothetical protein
MTERTYAKKRKKKDDHQKQDVEANEVNIKEIGWTNIPKPSEDKFQQWRTPSQNVAPQMGEFTKQESRIHQERYSEVPNQLVSTVPPSIRNLDPSSQFLIPISIAHPSTTFSFPQPTSLINPYFPTGKPLWFLKQQIENIPAQHMETQLHGNPQEAEVEKATVRRFELSQQPSARQRKSGPNENRFLQFPSSFSNSKGSSLQTLSFYAQEYLMLEKTFQESLME